MQFTRLRLSGFKSFVDPTELVIEPGLTGVVGPNGCGKSNLLEALRWVMGENSAKSMRGSGMDDVIFAGTSSRPSRNLAEVALVLDNESRTAPAAFNDEVQLEISRRIERESGSAYRLNGKDVRAKDVTLLFADASTGAHSPSLVSQGRIGSLINAKPKERRAVLEEAAGISGLHSRRKEAESKLRSAENNLERLHDVEVQFHEQIKNLKKQSRQATRYKNVSAEIRKLQAMILWMEWREIEENLLKTDAEARESLTIVAEVNKALAALNKEQAILASKLPALRETEAEIAAALHRYTVSKETLDGEERRLTQNQEALKSQLEQTDQDEVREQGVVRDAADVMQRLEMEKKALEDEINNQTDNVDRLAEELKARQEDTLNAEWALEELTQKQAQRQASRTNLARDVEEGANRLETLQEQKTAIEERLVSLESNNLFTRALSDAENHLSLSEQAIHKSREAYNEADQNRQEFWEQEQSAREELQAAESRLAKIRAESDALSEMLTDGLDENTEPVLDKLTVQGGYETALGAALDMDLDAPEEAAAADGASILWRDLGDMENLAPLPQGVACLADYVSAPGVLTRRLSQIGLVETPEQAIALMGELKTGQRLVTRAGGVWRWDGLSISPEAPSRAAIRLSQKNRLQTLKTDLEKQQQQTGEARTRLNKVQEGLNLAREEAKSQRNKLHEAEDQASKARRELTEAEKQAARHQSEESALKDRLGRLLEELESVSERYRTAKADLTALPPEVSMEQDIANARALVEEKRGILSEARLAHDGFVSRSSARQERLEAIENELSQWKNRLSNVTSQLQRLTERREHIGEELVKLQDRPGEIVEQRRKLNSLIDEAEVKRQEAARVLSEAEDALVTKEKEIREVQEKLTSAREDKVRLETNLDQYQEQQSYLKRRIVEEFDCGPGALREKAELEAEAELPDMNASQMRLEKLKGERERLGAVNLRADTELEEVEEHLSDSVREREELETAIARLRKAISDLNREGRARMLAAFETVNEHFSKLFTTLFGGGAAHLELTESDDPLDAGLEIMASPPGKKMQNLGLLSGGEQALTALSLIFAVFMTNPSPICVLDEVDAPLDDANVERFCNLLDQMIKQTSTRFLIVTHNALTMSRMHRLFGVTMAERGVSQLVSVDLESAERMRDRVGDSLLA